MAACRVDRLDVLADMVPGRSVTTRTVLRELADHDVDRRVLELGWPELVAVDEVHEIEAVVFWASLLGCSGRQDLGEVTVLAWAQVHGAVAVVDDGEARRVALRHGARLTGTLGLFAAAVNEGRQTPAGLCGLIDQLIGVGRARYKINSGAEFESWARGKGLLR